MKYKSEIVWNYVSLIIMAAIGLLMNTIVVAFYDTEALGLFNETYAWYMILSQVAVWGIHMAIVKIIPETSDEENRGAVLGTGLFLSFGISLAVSALSEIIIFALTDGEWQKSLACAFAGLTFMSLNKVLLNYINALNRMKAYAVLTSIRYILLGVFLLLLSAIGTDSTYLGIVFPMTEAIVFIILNFYFILTGWIKLRVIGGMIREIASFGTRILPAGLVLELNTKVDIVCLGFIVKDTAKIGIYSFAILFTEGFYMLYITIRKIVNPSLAEYNSKGKLEEKIQELKGQVIKYLRYGGPVAYIGVTLAYCVFCMILNKPNYYIGVVYILIICFSMVVTGRYIVLGDILAQVGLPAEESMLNILTVACNFALNILLIFLWGNAGAAIATAASHLFFALYLKFRVKKRINILI